MKRQVFAVFLLLLALSSTRLTHAEPTSQSVTFARTHYAQIERNLKNYKRVETDLPDQYHSTQGGTFIVYFHKGAPRKIVAWFYGETGNVQCDYYFWNGRLFFVLQTEERYDKSIYAALDDKTEIGKVVRRPQNRFYFADGKLIRWIANDGKFADLKSSQATQHERETLQGARQYLADANKLLDLAPSSTRLAHADSIAKDIAGVRTHYAQIERNLENYKRIQIDFPDQSPEGWTLIAYSHNGAPRKIVTHFLGEMGNLQDDYYFWGGRLFFVLETRVRYDEPLGKEKSRVHERLYFASGKVIRWINENGEIAKLKSSQAAQRERETLQDVREYLAKANKLLD